MGANEFEATGKGETFREAFIGAKEYAQHECGHGGYTGTIAEKHGVVERVRPAGVKLADFINDLWENDELCDDKWGPAVAVKVGPKEWVFIGLASS